MHSGTDIPTSQAETAADLYRRHAKWPIIDYHSHLPAEKLADNTPFRDLAELWIDGDHYKWRAMRIAGEAENVCSGSAPGQEKFRAWARTLVQMPASPLQAWSRMELLEIFGIQEALTPASADRIWHETLRLLRTEAFRPRELIAAAGVEILCTTNDPAESLEAHLRLAEERHLPFRVFPTFRPDAALCLHTPDHFRRWLSKLETSSGLAIDSLPAFLEALRSRFEFFDRLGCRLSDHGLDHCYAETCLDAEAGAIFRRMCAPGSSPPADDLEKWRSWLMRQVAEWNAEFGWTMMLHLGARRNNNTRLFSSYGADAGCDAIGDFPQGRRLVRFLDQLDAAGRLPKTILFNSNPSDGFMFATIAGSFFEKGIQGKVQHGPPWWFLDQSYGIEKHLDMQCAVGVLKTFTGMVTDSRSFLSFVRHGYFRKIVTTRLAKEMASGALDPEQTDIDELCKAIFYTNARSFFNWQENHEQA